MVNARKERNAVALRECSQRAAFFIVRKTEPERELFPWCYTLLPNEERIWSVGEVREVFDYARLLDERSRYVAGLLVVELDAFTATKSSTLDFSIGIDWL